MYLNANRNILIRYEDDAQHQMTHVFIDHKWIIEKECYCIKAFGSIEESKGRDLSRAFIISTFLNDRGQTINEKRVGVKYDKWDCFECKHQGYFSFEIMDHPEIVECILRIEWI